MVCCSPGLRLVAWNEWWMGGGRAGGRQQAGRPGTGEANSLGRPGHQGARGEARSTGGTSRGARVRPGGQERPQDEPGPDGPGPGVLGADEQPELRQPHSDQVSLPPSHPELLGNNQGLLHEASLESTVVFRS